MHSPIPPHVFRAYDIRGLSPSEISPSLCQTIGFHFGRWATSLGDSVVLIGRDVRQTSFALSNALSQGLTAGGCSIVDLGEIPTPVLYYGTSTLGISNGIMITASHNPGEYNGLKIILGGQALFAEGITELYRKLIASPSPITLTEPRNTATETRDLIPAYLAEIQNQIRLQRPLRVVVDAGNGMSGLVAPALFRALGCTVIERFTTPDGNFPNHHPDPSVPENLVDLQKTVLSEKADVGLAFDGDGDRLGVVDGQGNILWPDRLMMLFSRDVLARHPGGIILFDVKSTAHLPRIIEKAGGTPLLWRTGHSFIKEKMRQTGALLAGEMSGHIFFKERWFGFDDATYAGARLLEILASSPENLATLAEALPHSVHTPELKITVSDERKMEIMAKLSESKLFKTAENIVRIDGLRVSFPKGWGLIRASNTSPYLVLRFEADEEETLSEIQNQFRKALLETDESLELPF